MFLASAHVHPELLGLTLAMMVNGQSTCLRLEDYDHPVHHINAADPKARQRNCDCRIGDEIRISGKFSRDQRPSSERELNHRQHSQRCKRRALKASRILAELAA